MMVALDRSLGLLEIARTEHGLVEECVRGDLCFNAFREGLFVRVSPVPSFRRKLNRER